MGWYKDFFDKRIQQASSPFENIEAILNDQKHPKYQDAVNVLNYSTLVKIARSFEEFINSLFEDESEMEVE